MAFSGCTPIYRGATATWRTTFRDAFGNVIQPDGAVINIKYPVPGSPGATAAASVTMTPPIAPEVRWLGLWDSRGSLPGTIVWSIHTVQDDEEIPYAVEDGQFPLSANAANPLTF